MTGPIIKYVETMTENLWVHWQATSDGPTCGGGACQPKLNTSHIWKKSAFLHPRRLSRHSLGNVVPLTLVIIHRLNLRAILEFTGSSALNSILSIMLFSESLTEYSRHSALNLDEVTMTRTETSFEYGGHTLPPGNSQMPRYVAW